MDDTISRKAAIEALNEEIIKRWLLGNVNDGMLDEFDTESILRKLPSAQPEQRWISCKERLPENPIRVQIQMNNGWIITAYRQDGEWLSVPDCGEVLKDEWVEAWRPLPEPYKEDEHE